MATDPRIARLTDLYGSSKDRNGNPAYTPEQIANQVNNQSDPNASLNPQQYFDDYGKSRVADLSNSDSRASQAYDVKDIDKRLGAYYANKNAADARQAPVTDYSAANLDRSMGLYSQRQGQQDRGEQYQALGMTRDAAEGRGTSVAAAQYAQAVNAQRAQAASMAASAHGTGLQRAAAQRQAMTAGNDAGLNSAAGMAALRAQEIATARGQYLGGAGQIRQGDESDRAQAMQQQGIDAGQAQYDSGLALANRNANDARASFYENQTTHLRDQQYGSQLARQDAIMAGAGMDQQQQNINNGVAAAQYQRDASLASGIIQAGAGITGLVATAGSAAPAAVPAVVGGVKKIAGGLDGTSDRRAKTDIKPAGEKVKTFLDALNEADYEYKNKNTPTTSPGRHTSVMAQDLEKSELGRRMVHDTPQGKVVDYKEGLATMLAGLANVNDRLEQALKARKK